MEPQRTSHAGLISSLNEVAASVSSATNPEAMLATIVERAKRITDTDKAILVLSHEPGGDLDLESVIVRGRLGQHVQEWWQERLEALGDTVYERQGVFVEFDREQDAWLLCSPVRVRDTSLGLLCAINSADKPFSDEQIDFFAVLSAFAASAMEMGRLAEEGRYTLLASERDRIAREMHDGVIQSLFSVSIGLVVCKKQVIRNPTAVEARLGELQKELDLAMAELRRFMYDLRPVRLSEFGLGGAIKYWIREVTADQPVSGRLFIDGELPELSPAVESCLYRVAKECVSNVVQHAGASEFEVVLSGSGDRVSMVISDNGHGFDVEQALRASDGFGLHSIRKRVETEKGSITIQSTPGEGATVSVAMPARGAR